MRAIHRWTIGIDPGKTGGLALIEDETVMSVMPMPETARELARTLADWRDEARDNSILLMTYVEKAQAMPKNGSVSMFNYGQHMGEIIGILTTLEMSFILVPPATWSKKMHAGVTASPDTKKRSRIAVERLYPDLKLLATERSKKPHEGMVDAVLIAAYGSKQ